MLVIVSDLHLCDGTAFPQTVTPDVLALLYADLYALARRHRAKNLDIVFLGDVFDLLRSERWFEDDHSQPVPLAERPWGYDGALDGRALPEAASSRARTVLEGIIAHNSDVLASLRGETTAAEPPCTVRRIFLPGNHDRLYLLDEHIRQRVQAVLGATDERTLAHEGIFQHHMAIPRYSLLARHGHEWDRLNFQSFRPGAMAGDYTDADYLPTPLGDAVTTELVVALPYQLVRALDQTPEFRGTPELERVRARLEKIEDVRPLVGALQWPFYETERFRAFLGDRQHTVLRAHFRDVVHALAKGFLELPYFQAWRDRSGDMAFEIAFEALRVVDPSSPGSLNRAIAGLIDHFRGETSVDNGAAREDLSAFSDGGLRFVVYGHTHDPVQIPLRAHPGSDLYLNSGTWRCRESLTADRSGFFGWEQSTYLVFYDATESVDGAARAHPGYESWTGSRY
jgi:UDP-2,3-diacylglucosamine pyrophosphatase LpxH